LNALVYFFTSCNTPAPKDSTSKGSMDSSFNNFQLAFLDAYMKDNPSFAIGMGYTKYFELLDIPDSNLYSRKINFSKSWLDSLHNFDYAGLSDENKINYNIVQDQLKSDLWYVNNLKIYQWDPSTYNLGGECYSLITQDYAPLDLRLRILSAHLRNADKYYGSALRIIEHPTREHTALAIRQNKGSLEVFGNSLKDSINQSSLARVEKDSLEARIKKTIAAINNYVSGLEKMLADPHYQFRDFRIGKKLFDEKFKYDISSDYTAEEIFAKADSAKHNYHHQMFAIADQLWAKYYGGLKKSRDSLALIQKILDKIALHHASPKNVVDSASALIHRLEYFIINRNLFNYDTTASLKVRIMPAFAAGVALASADFLPPFQKSGSTYYNISDLSKMPAADAESELKETNDYSLQFLSIHEGIPGHCLQGIYNNKILGSKIKSVFGNGAMVEGWAVYCEQMMMENGWGENSPELWLTLYKWKLRECSNVIVDYGLHCLNYSKNGIHELLKKETFQEEGQISEKYHRATVSQVQLCSYFTGYSQIVALKAAYQEKTGSAYNLKNFHEKFLSYGSAPVKYIREMMLR
jgi:uncharacterized protein (DUF885 family)